LLNQSQNYTGITFGKQTGQSHVVCKAKKGIIWDISSSIIILETTIQHVEEMGAQTE